MYILAIVFFLGLGALVVEGFRQALLPLNQYLSKTERKGDKLHSFTQVLIR